MDEKTPEQVSKPGKRRRIIVILGALVVGVAAVAFWPGEKEPEYQGKKLSQWLEPALKGYRNEKEWALDAEKALGAAAVRQIGTNALPYLLKSIRYEPPAWRRNPPQVIFKLPFHAYRLFMDAAEPRAVTAVWGFEILGTEARTAVPELTRILRYGTWLRTRERAARALGYVGEDGVNALTSALEDLQTPRRRVLMLELGHAAHRGADISRAVPVMLGCMGDRENGLSAFLALDDLVTMQPARYLPVLELSLHDTNEVIRTAAALILTHTLGDLEGGIRRDAAKVLEEAPPRLVESLKLAAYISH
jgi:hypothetical protein